MSTKGTPGLPPAPQEASPELLAQVKESMEAVESVGAQHLQQQEAFIDPNIQQTAEAQDAAAKNNAKYQNRGEVEDEIVNKPKFRDMVLEGEWEGKNTIRIPRWMAWQYFTLSEAVAKMIITLFPNNYFFLFYVDHSEIASATAQVQDILFNKVGKEVTRIVMETCKIDPDREKEFLESITGWDLVELFLCIIEMNINNDSMRALQKKFKRLLGERFALENVFPDWEDIMAGHQSTAPEASPMKNSLSFTSMQSLTRK